MTEPSPASANVRNPLRCVPADVLTMAANQIRMLGNHWRDDQAALERLVPSQHDARMPDGTCMTCTVLEVLEHDWTRFTAPIRFVVGPPPPAPRPNPIDPSGASVGTPWWLWLTFGIAAAYALAGLVLVGVKLS